VKEKMAKKRNILYIIYVNVLIVFPCFAALLETPQEARMKRTRLEDLDSAAAISPKRVRGVGSPSAEAASGGCTNRGTGDHHPELLDLPDLVLYRLCTK
jgi:hypothetical protein